MDSGEWPWFLTPPLNQNREDDTKDLGNHKTHDGPAWPGLYLCVKSDEVSHAMKQDASPCESKFTIHVKYGWFYTERAAAGR